MTQTRKFPERGINLQKIALICLFLATFGLKISRVWPESVLDVQKEFYDLGYPIRLPKNFFLMIKEVKRTFPEKVDPIQKMLIFCMGSRFQMRLNPLCFEQFVFWKKQHPFHVFVILDSLLFFSWMQRSNEKKREQVLILFEKRFLLRNKNYMRNHSFLQKQNGTLLSERLVRSKLWVYPNSSHFFGFFFQKLKILWFKKIFFYSNKFL